MSAGSTDGMGNSNDPVLLAGPRWAPLVGVTGVLKQARCDERGSWDAFAVFPRTVLFAPCPWSLVSGPPLLLSAPSVRAFQSVFSPLGPGGDFTLGTAHALPKCPRATEHGMQQQAKFCHLARLWLLMTRKSMNPGVLALKRSENVFSK